MVGVHTTTRMETRDGEEATLLVVPPAVKEAIAMVESDSPLVAVEGFSKLSQATFNNRTLVVLVEDCYGSDLVCARQHANSLRL